MDKIVGPISTEVSAWSDTPDTPLNDKRLNIDHNILEQCVDYINRVMFLKNVTEETRPHYPDNNGRYLVDRKSIEKIEKALEYRGVTPTGFFNDIPRLIESIDTERYSETIIGRQYIFGEVQVIEGTIM